jgi:hypothetical protein
MVSTGRLYSQNHLFQKRLNILNTYVQTLHYYVFHCLARKLKENLCISMQPKALIGVVLAVISINNCHFIDNRKI